MGKMSVTVPGKTINELLQHWASTAESHLPAFVSVKESGETSNLTRKEIFQCAGRFAHRLIQVGVRKGSIVCSTLPNSIERVICDMGIFLSGATSLNGQLFHADGSGFLKSLKVTKAQFVIVNPKAEKGAMHVLTSSGIENLNGCVNSSILPHLQRIIFCERCPGDIYKDFISSLKDEALPTACIPVQSSDIASVMTSSGSTGYSKLIQLTHGNLCHFCVQVKAMYSFNSGDGFMNCALIGWAGGFPQWYLGSGVTRYFIDMFDGPPKNLPQTFWTAIANHHIIYGFVSPMYVGEILRNQSWWLNSQWKPEILCLAGQPIKREHLKIIGRLCKAVDINYGMTECNLVSTLRVWDPNLYEDNCAGFPGYGVQIKIVDKERNEVPHGIVGEVLVKSPSLTLGYFNNDEANERSFTSDGWLCTDDVGSLDEQGRICVHGRQSDTIMRGTYILYPTWLEAEIKKVSGVKDIVVVPVPDPDLHHEICACIITDKVQNPNPRNFSDSTFYIPYSISPKVPSNEGSENREGSFSIDKTTEPNAMNDFDDVDGPSSSTHTNTYDIRDLEKIRISGMKKNLNTDYNVTKTKLIENNVTAESKNCLQLLEADVRNFCDTNQLLSERDPQRMIPKYYVFWEQFPLTNTGKINRKEISRQAAGILNLLP